MIIRNIHNAFTIVMSRGFKIVCDPWISDGIFDGGWGKFPSVENIEKYLDDTTHCFISHIHEDHFDLDAIKLLDKDVKFLIPNIYPNHVIKNTIKELGFDNIEMLEVDTSYEIEKDLFFDVIPPMNSKGLETFDNDYSGDLGFLSVDAGVMIRDNDGKIVLLSDNGPYELSDEMISKIKGCDLLAFPFNGVADDYPVCFDNLTLKQKKKKSLERQEKRTELQCDSIVKIQPKNLMPYSSDMVILGKRAKDFVDVHPIEYLVRDKVSKIYEERTNIPTHAIYSEDVISILDREVRVMSDGEKPMNLNIKDYAYSKHNEDVNNSIIYSEVDSFYTLYDNFVQSCDNMFKVMKKLKLKSEWTLSFYITDMDEYLTVNIGNKHISNKKSNDKNLQLCNIRSGYLNSHFLFIHHWNNSIISYNLDWERKNDVYDYGLNKGLNFLHIERA